MSDQKDPPLSISPIEEESTLQKTSEFEEALEKFLRDKLNTLPFFKLAASESAKEKMGLTIKGYLQCRVEECPYYAICPLMKGLRKSERESLRNTDCRLEVVQAAKSFVDLVRKLEIESDSVVDLTYCSQIIINQIYLDRIDRDTAVNGITQENPSVINQKTGVVYPVVVMRETLKMRNFFMKAIDDAISKLNASRKDKAKSSNKIEDIDALREMLSYNDKKGAILAEFKEE